MGCCEVPELWIFLSDPSQREHAYISKCLFETLTSALCTILQNQEFLGIPNVKLQRKAQIVRETIGDDHNSSSNCSFETSTNALCSIFQNQEFSDTPNVQS